jgi:hypothetical protein
MPTVEQFMEFANKYGVPWALVVFFCAFMALVAWKIGNKLVDRHSKFIDAIESKATADSATLKNIGDSTNALQSCFEQQTRLLEKLTDRVEHIDGRVIRLEERK